MLKPIIATAALLAIAGCASTGQWRDLRIDGTSETAFDDSVMLIHEQLPETYRRMFRLALSDIVNTGVAGAGQTDDGASTFTPEVFRRELDGLTYKGVIALADQTGTPIATQYYSRRDATASRAAGFGPYPDRNRGQPAFADDGRPMSDYRPYGERWPTGTDGRRAIYPDP